MGCYPTGNFIKPASDAATSILNHRTPYLLPMRSFEVIVLTAGRFAMEELKPMLPGIRARINIPAQFRFPNRCEAGSDF
jgi:hypothetical protein